MTKRAKIEIAIAVLVLVILAFLLWFFLRPAPQDGSNVDGGVSGQVDSTPDVPERVTTVDSRTQESPPDVIARSFIERLGSYSTDVNYVNVEDVKAFVTPELSVTLDGVVASALEREGGEYYGVSTRIISIEQLETGDDSAYFRLTTQRTESIGSPANTSTRYQDVEVGLVKIGLKWLVDEFTWIE